MHPALARGSVTVNSARMFTSIDNGQTPLRTHRARGHVGYCGHET